MAKKTNKKTKKSKKNDQDLKHKKGKSTVATSELSNGRHAKIQLAEPLQLRGVTLRNRTVLPPMCMYSVTAMDGRPTNFHYQHYVSRALGGFGMIIVEATAVSPEGRISPCDLGLWEDSQIDSFRWIVDAMREAGTVPAIQLGHAGRKASTGCSHLGIPSHAYVDQEHGGWQTIAPSAIPFGDLPAPHAMSADQIHLVEDQFRDAAWRAVEAGFQAIEIHAAHGYLINEFLDPLSNMREDEYGGPFRNRVRMLIEICDKIRAVIPDTMPLLVRVSATDWAGGWETNDTVRLAKELKEHGVDLVDVSTGGVVPVDRDVMHIGPGYQVPFSARVHREAEIPTTAVGIITKPKQAERILRDGDATAIEIGREALSEPYWPLRALARLGIPQERLEIPDQYQRGFFTKR